MCKKYYCFGEEAGDKRAKQGLSKKQSPFDKDSFLDVPKGRESGKGVDRGFHMVGNRMMTLEKAGLTYFCNCCKFF